MIKDSVRVGDALDPRMEVEKCHLESFLEQWVSGAWGQLY